MREGTSAVFDIGGSSIGAALVTTEGSHAPPKVLYSTRALFPFLKEPEPERLTQAMLSTFVVVALRVQREGLPRLPHALPFRSVHVREASCFFSSPWLSTEASNVSMRSERPFNVHNNIAGMLFNRNEEFPHVEYFPFEQEDDKHGRKKRSHATKSEDMGGATSIERHVVRVSLNGYPTNKPEGKLASTLEALVVGSVVPSDLFDKLRAVIDRVLRGGELYGHSFFMPLSRVARSIAAEDESYLLIQVGGEITDVVVVENGTPTLFVSIPFGVQPLIRAIAAKARIIPEEVGARLALLARSGNTGEEDRKGSVIVRTLSETEAKWKDLIRDALREAPFRTPLPNRAYVWCDEAYQTWFTRLFSSIALPEATFNTATFETTPLGRNAVSGFASFSREEEYDSALAMAAAFVRDLSV